jgi:putative PIN family toxin of toxin-antitoxin system
MKVFLDTNVLISAFLGSGLCRELLRTIADEHQLCISWLVIDEYQRVLRDKFGAGKADLKEALMLVHQAAVLSDTPTEEFQATNPTNDVVIMTTVRDAGVDLLVTGDRGMLSIAVDFDVVAVSPRGFFQLMAQADDAYPLAPDDDAPIVSESQGSPIRDKSFSFALKIIKLYQQLQDQREYVISKQLLRSGTSIGANVEEAIAAESKRDFIHKMKIAMKESRETHYWLRLLEQSDLAKGIDLADLLSQADELSRILTSITKTASENARR